MTNDKSLKALEFDKIRERLSQFALTGLGKELCLNLRPQSRIERVLQAQEETEEALVLLNYRGDSPIGGFEDMRPQIHLAFKGATLSLRALLDIGYCLRAALTARAGLVTDRENTPRLRALAMRLHPMRPLERLIFDTIISEEEISDHASTDLAEIRRQMRLCNARIRDRLQTMIHSSQYSKYLQEPLVTLRNGRYTIPVKQEYRQNVPGLIHDQSSTGATFFIEPMAVVEAGNELKQWEIKEQKEIERILSALSGQIGDSADEISSDIELLSELDFIFAKAALAKEMVAIQPKMNQNGYLRFIQVRHPLIPREQVVPCNLWLGDDFTSLIITGPNTGGKTVTLKTVGLISVMAASGLHVPGQLGTELSLFDRVFADIGDEQSIEQSLSTFSSHMTNIVGILNEACPGDLVLFDELGAGTDPTEGAALAQAILSLLLKQKIRTVATTHYSELKAYALNTPGVENASVEFDVSTLSPTYRLSIGIPGKSNAFEISRRLGLSDQIISRAKELLSHDSVRFEDVIANAEYHRQLAEKERRLTEEAYQESLKLRKEAQKLYKDAEEQVSCAKLKGKEEARRIVQKAKIEVASLLEDVRLFQKEGGQSGFQKRLREMDDAFSEGLKTVKSENDFDPEKLKEGDSVILLSTNTQATVLQKPDSKGEVTIQAGAFKMKVPIQQLTLVKNPKTRQTQVHTKLHNQDLQVKMECDVRGMALDEAIAETDRYLDLALISGLHEVAIIHGKGTGVLRAGIQRHLKTLASVSTFRQGKFGEGESGVTVVTLK